MDRVSVNKGSFYDQKWDRDRNSLGSEVITQLKEQQKSSAQLTELKYRCNPTHIATYIYLL